MVWADEEIVSQASIMQLNGLVTGNGACLSSSSQSSEEVGAMAGNSASLCKVWLEGKEGMECTWASESLMPAFWKTTNEYTLAVAVPLLPQTFYGLQRPNS
jgi:hypothetical protein